MVISGDTILRTLCHTIEHLVGSQPNASPPEVVIDDWAFRRGRRFRTIIVDLERRRPNALLPDRETYRPTRFVLDSGMSATILPKILTLPGMPVHSWQSDNEVSRTSLHCLYQMLYASDQVHM
jgi:hypothetical protein